MGTRYEGRYCISEPGPQETYWEFYETPYSVIFQASTVNPQIFLILAVILLFLVRFKYPTTLSLMILQIFLKLDS
jgi:hypothetical protein